VFVVVFIKKKYVSVVVKAPGQNLFTLEKDGNFIVY
jgi:hypothetical protein